MQSLHHRRPLGWSCRTCPWWSHAGCCWIPQLSPHPLWPVYSPGGYAFFDLPFLADTAVEALLIILCIPCQVRLQPHLGLSDPIATQPGSTPILFPGYLSLLPSCPLVWPAGLDSAMLVFSPPFLISYTRGLRSLVLLWKAFLKIYQVCSAPLSLTHHQRTDAQPVPRQWPTPARFPLSLYAEHDIVWYGISLWPAWISCPGCVSSQLLVHPQPPRCQGSMRGWKVLNLVWELLSNN